jgi:hypothetical protein
MFSTRGRTIVTTAVLLEVGIAGWVMGAGALWLLVATAVITIADTVWGMLRRRAWCDLAGLEIALTLVLVLLAGNDPWLSVVVAAACLAWLIRPERQPAQAETTA